jgi:CRP/FNR family transcriptional regulator
MPQGSNSRSPDSCLDCPHRARSSWRGLDDTALAAIDRVRRTRTYEPGQAVFAQGTDGPGVCCVRSGTLAERRLDSDGNTVLLALHYPSDLVGYRALLTGGEHQTSAEALGRATVCVIEAAAVAETMTHHPEVAMELLRRSSAEVDRAQDQLFRAATLSNRDRLILLLLDLLRRHGRAGADGAQAIELPLSRRDLASMIGVRHETLSRLMGRLEADGLASFSGRHVTIADPRALAAAAPQPSND